MVTLVDVVRNITGTIGHWRAITVGDGAHDITKTVNFVVVDKNVTHAVPCDYAALEDNDVTRFSIFIAMNFGGNVIPFAGCGHVIILSGCVAVRISRIPTAGANKSMHIATAVVAITATGVS